MKVKITSEDELKEVAAELLHCLVNVRHWSDLWHEHHGGYYLGQKKKWEKRSDELLERLNASYMNERLGHIKIEIKDEATNNSA